MSQSKIKVKNAAAASSSAKEIALEFARISQLTANGKKDEAWQAANGLYAKNPTEATPNFIIALILTESDQKSDALPHAEAAVKLSPHNAGYHVFLGKLYVDLELLEYASAVLDKAFFLDQTMFQAPGPWQSIILNLVRGKKRFPTIRKRWRRRHNNQAMLLNWLMQIAYQP